jgi:photosystem II stability/assembly factor-like uncharacterized protein
MKQYRVCVIMATLVIFLGLSATPMMAVSGAASKHAITPGTELTNTALNGYSQVDQVDMLSSSLGYAIATHLAGNGIYRYYLVRTTNEARTWTVRSEFPSNNRYPIFTDFSTYESDPFIDFVNRNIGYVDGPGGSIYVTDDGGSTWAMVGERDSTSSYGISGSIASVVTTSCRTPNGSQKTQCNSILSEYAIGSAVPIRVTAVPGTHTDDYALAALLAVAPHGTQIINLANDAMSTSKSLLITHNDGQSWATLTNPCATSLIGQLIVASDGQWLLACFHDYGMSHGTAQIFRSTNEGVTWSTVLDDTYQRNIVGNLGGTPAYYFFSGNDQTLYAAMLGPAGGLEVSTDGGTMWSSDTAMPDIGGQIGSMSTFGPTSALYQVFQGPMYVTSNGRTWHLLPKLPPGKYRGLSICTGKSVKLSLRSVKFGHYRYTYVDFTNDSTTPCYLDGAPIARLMNAHFQEVGPPETNGIVDSSGDFVTVEPGHVANVSLFIGPISGYKPPSTCTVHRMSSIRFSFGGPSHFILALGPKTLRTWCTNPPSVEVIPIRSGPGKT